IIKNTKSFTLLIHQAKYPIVFLLTGASPIVVIITYFTFLKYFAELNREVLLFISSTSVMLFLTLFIIFAGMYAKLLDQTFESKYNLEYANNVKALLTDLREFKHDFNNMMNGFKGCVCKGNIEDLHKYCEDFEASFLPADNNIYNLGQIQNPAVFGVFVLNLEQIKALHSEVNIMESVAFDTILDNASLCRVMGVILDNAIEAAGASKEKRLIIDILADTVYTSVIIKNSYRGKLDLNNLHPSSKDEGRGAGLYSLEKILNKHKSIVHSFYIDESNYFTQQLSIPNKNRAL
ncbi:MAG: GHKL domain-containing protein, partial [Bacillota bacterium]